MKTILFGGTFDPVHNAHLEIASAAGDRFPNAGIVFIPAANPPHKNQGPHASYEDRVRMLQIACMDCDVSRVEEGVERSYSIHTIEKLRHRGPLGFLIGADAFAEIQTWYRWQDVVREVEFIVAARPGAAYGIPAGVRVTEIPDVQRTESSSGIRRMIAEGMENIPVPSSVLDYIHAHGLYQSQALRKSQSYSPYSR